MKAPSFDPAWMRWWMNPSVYEWLLSYPDLMRVRESCWTHCWLSEAAWTEWKNYSRRHYVYVRWLPGNTRSCVLLSTTHGIRQLYASDRLLFETSIQVLRSVARLRISKSLTCDALNAWLTETLVAAMRRWSQFDYAIVVPRMSGKTSSLSPVSVSSSQLWSDENSDPLEDLRRFASLPPEEKYRGLY